MNMCIVRGCTANAEFEMCHEHLDTPPINPIRLNATYEINPPPPIGLLSKCPQLKLASALLSVSPLNLKTVNKNQRRSVREDFNKKKILFMEFSITASPPPSWKNIFTTHDFRPVIFEA